MRDQRTLRSGIAPEFAAETDAPEATLGPASPAGAEGDFMVGGVDFLLRKAAGLSATAARSAVRGIMRAKTLNK
jgi:hypothetical protein